ncbi:MAG: carboxyl transferase domain-containing protein [Bacteriovoracaceae bacterium]
MLLKPDVIKTVTHEEVTKETLGGSATHNEISGVAHFRSPNEDACFGTSTRAIKLPTSFLFLTTVT